VARAFKQSPRRLDKQLKKANKEAIEKALVPAVRAGAPKRSGRLAGSVRALATAQKAQLAVGSNVKVPYAGPINFGWPARNIASQEFIYAGINKSDSKTLEIYVEELDKVAKDIAPRGKL
jgi:hypothetical protein